LSEEGEKQEQSKRKNLEKKTNIVEKTETRGTKLRRRGVVNNKFVILYKLKS